MISIEQQELWEQHRALIKRLDILTEAGAFDMTKPANVELDNKYLDVLEELGKLEVQLDL